MDQSLSLFTKFSVTRLHPTAESSAYHTYLALPSSLGVRRAPIAYMAMAKAWLPWVVPSLNSIQYGA